MRCKPNMVYEEMPESCQSLPPVQMPARHANHSPLEMEFDQDMRQEHGLQITPPLRKSGKTAPLEGESARGRSPQSSRWGEMKRSYTQQTLERAKTLRQSQTDAEGLLWHYLCRKQLDGYKFRRQQPIGPYIVDFACMSRKLVIELDGGQHAERHAYDETRDDYLRGKGYRILRFWNNEVFQNCMDVLEAVYQALVSPPPHQPVVWELGDCPPTASAVACRLGFCDSPSRGE